MFVFDATSPPFQPSLETASSSLKLASSNSSHDLGKGEQDEESASKSATLATKVDDQRQQHMPPKVKSLNPPFRLRVEAPSWPGPGLVNQFRPDLSSFGGNLISPLSLTTPIGTGNTAPPFNFNTDAESSFGKGFVTHFPGNRPNNGRISSSYGRRAPRMRNSVSWNTVLKDQTPQDVIDNIVAARANAKVKTRPRTKRSRQNWDEAFIHVKAMKEMHRQQLQTMTSTRMPHEEDRAQGLSSVPVMTSTSYESPQVIEARNFSRICRNLKHLGVNSPFVPSNLTDWIEFRTEGNKREKVAIEQRIADSVKVRQTFEPRLSNSSRSNASPSSVSKIQTAMAGKHFPDDRSTVLAQFTRWTPWVSGRNDSLVPWPDLHELQWDGADRARNGYGRFLPLPRQLVFDINVGRQLEESGKGLEWDGIGLIPWHLRTQVRASSLDKVGGIWERHTELMISVEEDETRLLGTELLTSLLS